MTCRNITFITGNPRKLLEVQQLLEKGSTLPIEIISKNIDLAEYQGLPDEIATKKCEEALKHVNGPVLVEDTSLCYQSFGGLPGPYVKWFLHNIGPEGLYKMLDAYHDKSASALTILAYGKTTGNIKLFHGETQGTIVYPRGSNNFGWDCCFQPDGSNMTYGEMTKEEKHAVSHRSKAIFKFKNYIANSFGNCD